MNSILNLKRFYILMLVLTVGAFLGSCESDELEDPSLENVNNELALTVSDEDLLLNERFLSNELGFTWSTGTNRGTGAAIQYTLEIDHAGGDFSDPLISIVEDVKNRYSASIDHGTLNHRLLNSGLDAGTVYELEARLTAEVTDPAVEDQVSKKTFSVGTFKPVSSKLYIVGDATPNGWNISNAIELASTGQRGVFVYEGKLTEGNFKFPVSRNDCWCQDFYTKDPNNENAIVFNEGGSGEDVQWTITEAGNYRLRIDLLNKTFEMTPIEDAPFSELFIVGDATESGWNVDAPAAFTQSELDPFVFNYEGNLAPGELKIFAGPMGDWCGEWYRPGVDDQGLVNGPVVQAAGCEPDNTWLVTEEAAGRYKISLNTATNTIRFNKVNLHIVGDAGPNGWNINNPAPMEYVDGEFFYSGPLSAGELKFSKYQGDWCDGEWINAAENGQAITNTEFITTFGCEGPDNKWRITASEAGDYEIRINLDTEIMTVTAL